MPRFSSKTRKAPSTRVTRLGATPVLQSAILVPVAVALFLLATPLARSLAERQRAAADDSAARASQLAGADRARALDKAATELALAREIEERRHLFVGAVVLLVVWGALHDVFMQSLNAFFRRREWNAITLVGNLLQPVLVASAVLLGYGVRGVSSASRYPLLCLVLSAPLALAKLPPGTGGRPPGPTRPPIAMPPSTTRCVSSWPDLPFLVLAAQYRLGGIMMLGFGWFAGLSPTSTGRSSGS
jgi:hypothetical protein